MDKKKKRKVRIRVPLWIHLLRPLFWIYYHGILKYTQKSKYKIQKGETAIILSNHQTDLDALYLHCAFNRFVYTVATDNIFNKKSSKWLKLVGVFPKRKGLTDITATMEMTRITSNGGTLLLFPEGNRSYAEFQFYISDIAQFIRKYKLTVILHNIHGGFGTSPRFGNKRRKGPFYGEVKRVLHFRDYENWTNEELIHVIREELKVYDSESGNLYKSEQRAEYLERMFFICPKCGKVSTLRSEGNYISCDSCGLKVEYTEDLHLRSEDEKFKYTKLVEWYDFERKWIRDFEVNPGEIIFKDVDATLVEAIPFGERIELTHGDITLTDKDFNVGSYHFDVKDIEIASPVSGRNLVFTCSGKAYQIRGNERFNALKYVFMFNRLDTIMNNKKTDSYYRVDGELYL